MGKPPHPHETGVKAGDRGPIRTAGTVPGPAQNPGRADAFPDGPEDT
jgi:cytochrome d ubiquinol oxidase subunit I